MTPTLHLLDWTGSALGLLGAYLLAFRMSASRYGWLAFFAANVAYVVLARQLGVMGLFAQQLGFLGSSAIGIYRHFFANARDSAQEGHAERDAAASWSISARLAKLATAPPNDRAGQLELLIREAKSLHDQGPGQSEGGRAEGSVRRASERVSHAVEGSL